jgi:hypothetical protein
MSKVEQEIEKTLKSFMQEVYSDVGSNVGVFARALLTEAIANREMAPNKHNFTGNLLGSIVVCVYEDNKPFIAYYPAQYGIKAIRFKMTAPRSYGFKRDYEGTESHYDPEIETNEGWGEDDAKEFFQEYNPGSKTKFCIVVAYTTEYASFVEAARHTTGFTNTYWWAKYKGRNILHLPWTASEPDTSFAPF